MTEAEAITEREALRHDDPRDKRIEKLETCIREMQRAIPGGQFVGCQEMADEFRAIALRYEVKMGDE